MKTMSIKDAASQSGVKIPTIRYYEQIGLLASPKRDAGNRRVFLVADLRRLAFIRSARELGFDVDAIRTLLQLQDRPNQLDSTAGAIAQARLAEVNQRIRGLMALKTELEQIIEGRAQGRVSDCQIIERLGGAAPHALAGMRY